LPPTVVVNVIEHRYQEFPTADISVVYAGLTLTVPTAPVDKLKNAYPLPAVLPKLNLTKLYPDDLAYTEKVYAVVIIAVPAPLVMACPPDEVVGTTNVAVVDPSGAVVAFPVFVTG